LEPGRIFLRFYEELNDFLPLQKRKVEYVVAFKGGPSVKQVIEAEGVPHAEVDLVLINGIPVTFGTKVADNDHVSVYPVFESLDISSVNVLRLKPLREPRFVLDVHLGKLARYMRMLGFDVLYENTYSDDELVEISVNGKRTILTRDLRLLMRKEVTRGYWIRHQMINDQLKEVMERLDLTTLVSCYSRCTACNGILLEADESKAKELLPDHVFYPQTKFYRCTSCGHLYWNGSHCERFEERMRNSEIAR
jgi:uncharacterized protein